MRRPNTVSIDSVGSSSIVTKKNVCTCPVFDKYGRRNIEIIPLPGETMSAKLFQPNCPEIGTFVIVVTDGTSQPDIFLSMNGSSTST